MYVVIGSGPTGIACASALLQQGKQVLLVDVGRELEPEKKRRLVQLQKLPPSAISSSDIADLSSEYPISKQGIPFKFAYGSSFPYAIEEMKNLEQHGTNCWQSFAKGGFSTVWGGTVLPYTREEMSHWPVNYDEFIPHYEAVSKLMGVAGTEDGLASVFPFFSEPLPAAKLSHQGNLLLQKWTANEKKLNDHGFRFGRSRLALKTKSNADSPGCQYIARCHTGCIYSAIFSSATVLAELEQNQNFKYQSGITVEEVARLENGKVKVKGKTLTEKKVEWDADRIFLAAGVISSSKIVIKSRKWQNRTFQLAYHPYFLWPFMMLSSVKKVDTERLHTLSQLFLELKDKRISNRWVHMQLSTYNDIIKSRLGQYLGPLKFLRGWVEKLFLGRLVAIQGYLHSSEGTQIQVTAKEDAHGKLTLGLNAGDIAQSRKITKKIQKKFLSHWFQLHLIPLPFLNYTGKPGDGNHIGGIFPMRHDPNEFETSPLGQFPDWPGIHLVDASIFPDLPATTITFTAMANAHRIGTMVAKMDTEKRKI